MDWGGLFEAALPALVESGVGALAGISQSSANRDQLREANALARDQFEFSKEKALAELELAKQRLAQGGAGNGAAAAIARQRLVADAYRSLIEASLAGSGNQVSALNNMLVGAQRGLV